MKSLIIFGVGLVFSTAIISCQKEQSKQLSSPNQANSGNLMTMDYEPVGKINASIRENKPCGSTATDCSILPEIVIKPSVRTEIINAQGNPTLVADAFLSEDFEPIRNVIDEGMLQRLQSGDYDILVTFDDGNNLVFVAGEGEVTNETFEFGVQLAI